MASIRFGRWPFLFLPMNQGRQASSALGRSEERAEWAVRRSGAPRVLDISGTRLEKERLPAAPLWFPERNAFRR